jgi:hypothetical protein
LRPVGESSVGDDEGIRVPDAANERIDRRVEDAFFKHVTPIC